MRNYRITKAFKIAGIMVVATAVFGYVVELLWNWLVPALFGLSSINFLQSLGLLALSKILFGGFHRHAGRRGGWNRQMGERWAGMSPGEREQFRSGMRRRSGCRPEPVSEPAEQAQN